MHKLKEMFMKELKEYEGKELTSADHNTLHLLTDTLKNIYKIEMLSDEGGYSEGRWEAMGSYDGGNSERRGHYVRGHYSRDGYSRDGYSNEGSSSYDGGSSYARRDSMGRYSRAGGKEQMMEKLEEMMGAAENDRQREVIHRCVEEFKHI